jgi:hypothetical protein
MTLLADLQLRVAALRPDADCSALRLVDFAAQVTPVQALQPDERQVLATATKQAAVPLTNADGKPTVLKVVAWMVHGDLPNRNRDAFVGEELRTLAPGIAAAPNFLPMDWNHAAVNPFVDGPKTLGVWYRTEWAFDKNADEGRGAWGVLATGMVWAWMYPEQANIMLGEQARNGTVAFSMACLPGGVEYRKDENGSYAVLHNPTFFTLSALDVPPADPDALGKATIDPAVSDFALRDLALASTTTSAAWTNATYTTTPWLPYYPSTTVPAWPYQGTQPLPVTTWDPTGIPGQPGQFYINGLPAAEDSRMKEHEQLIKAKEEAEAVAAELRSQLEALTSKAEELAAARTQIEQLETKVSELEVVRDAANTLNARQAEQLAELEAKVAEQLAELTAFRDKAAAQAAAARLAARLEKLPPEFVAAHQAKPEATRARLQAKWEAMSDEDWDLYVAEELLGYAPGAKPNYVARTAAEGGALPSGGTTESMAERLARLNATNK